MTTTRAAMAAIPLPVADATAPTQLAGAPAPVVAPVDERERRWPWYVIGGLALALVAALAFLILSGVLATDKKEVPRVTGKQLVKARAIMERAGFDVQTERVQSAQPFDQVLDQDPNAGEEAEVGSKVTLEVSGGPGEVLVPAVDGLTEVEAVKELHKAGLEVTTDPEFSDKVKKGNAIRTVPKEGSSITKGTRVRLLVSQGPEQVTVPDVTGLSQTSAESRLRDAHLEVSVDEQESEDVADGDVISQSPTAGNERRPRLDGHDHRFHRQAEGQRSGRGGDEGGQGELRPRAGRPHARQAGARGHRPDPGRRGDRAAAGIRLSGGQGQRRGDRRGRPEAGRHARAHRALSAT